jgi:hypothetical protein
MSARNPALPAAVTAIVMAVSLPLFAQPPPSDEVPPDDEVLVEQAEKLYNEAREARKAGRYPDCYGAAAAAWKLAPRPKVAAIAGDCALDVGRAREAAERLQYFVDNPPKRVEPKVLEYFQSRLGEAKQKIVTVRVKVNIAAAAVRIDNKPVDGAPVFLDPGAHDFEATHDGYQPASAHLDLLAGDDREVPLELQPIAAPPPNGGDHERSYAPEIGLGIAGGAALVVGAVLLGVGFAQKSDAQDTIGSLKTESGREFPCDEPQYDATRCEDASDGLGGSDALIPTGGVALGVGAALIAGALIHYAIVGDGSTEPTTSIRVGPTSFALSVGF